MIVLNEFGKIDTCLEQRLSAPAFREEPPVVTMPDRGDDQHAIQVGLLDIHADAINRFPADPTSKQLELQPRRGPDPTCRFRLRRFAFIRTSFDDQIGMKRPCGMDRFQNIDHVAWPDAQ